MSSLSRQLASPAAPQQAEPIWIPANALPATTPEPALREWLVSPGLLTRRAQSAATEGFSLRVVREQLEARSSETAVLGCSSPNAWVREIELMSGSDVLIYAHTVVPQSTLVAHPWLRKLGRNSLGVTLQSVPNVTRSPFEFACLDERHELWERAMRNGEQGRRELWARRSWFAIKGDRLLVAEVFVLANQVEHRPSSVRSKGGVCR